MVVVVGKGKIWGGGWGGWVVDFKRLKICYGEEGYLFCIGLVFRIRIKGWKLEIGLRKEEDDIFSCFVFCEIECFVYNWICFY